jgi:hypothetical protein
MTNPSRVAVIGTLGLTLTIGCAPKPVEPQWVDAPIVQVVEADPVDWKRDQFALDSAVVDGDSIWITIKYSGGCQVHTFALFMSPGIIKTNPPQVELYLRHSGHGDACRVLITQTIAFDIAPIHEHLAAYHGYTDGIWLDLYNFNQDEFVQILYPEK